MKRLLQHFFLFALFGSAIFQADAAEVRVFAAASLTDAMQAIATGYEARSRDKILFNFAGSNVLARQIIERAPADLFLSADEIQMDAVEKAGMIANKSRRDLLSNTLVIILPSNSTLKVQRPGDLAKREFKRIALGDPEMVPAGVYAKRYLEGQGIWEALQKQIVPTEDVRAALAAVASGNTDAGIVYKTDALISKRVKVAYEVPAADGPKILYPVALIKDSTALEAAQNFLWFLQSQEAKEIFARNGFVTVN